MISGNIRRRRSPLLVAFALLPLAALMRCSDVASCPNCIHSPGETREPPAGSAAADAIRLEAIKYRILSKLGLKQKPDVSRALPRDVVLKTLYRAEEMFSGMHHHHNPSSPKPPPQPPVEKPTTTDREEEDAGEGQEDDFYGRTREIITFAEQGTYGE
ncbi:uncharacterized protein LOC113375999 [Ctenocephalides felis]|uniref:uncharacterized protein LOC113375999 n=1 Tax=Ctenocephalides felis TaxID=7515 RepID=UPI000E6E2C85|nr:uncharacterized protein LOC113375999 [Ctenocephalides felis]